jgi:AraC-like DNA-binding protein
MKRLFEPVLFDHTSLTWDYGLVTERDFKGYYHWHQCCEIVLVHGGEGSIVLNRQAYDIHRGMFFFFQPFQLHHIHAEVSPACPYSRSIFYLNPLLVEEELHAYPKRHALFQSLWKAPGVGHAYDLGHHTEAMEWIYASYDQARSKGRGENTEEITLLLLQILGCLDMAAPQLHTAAGPEVAAGGSLRYSETIMRWLEKHYQEEVSLDRLAEETHLSKAYVSRVFRKETGSSLTDYLTARRIKEACKLLQTTDMPVELIGGRVGIPNSSYFIQLFKRQVGTTPLQYRLQL